MNSADFCLAMLDSVLKALLVLLLAWSVLRCFGGQWAAATRHQVWRLALAATLLLPGLSLLLPAWQVPIGEFDGQIWNSIPLAETESPTRESLPPIESTLPNAEASAPPRSVQFHAIYEPAWTLIGGLWLAGVVGALLRLVLAWFALQRLSRKATLVAGELQAETQRIADRWRLNGQFTVMVSARRSMPMVWGFWRSRVLLPIEAYDWSAPQIRSALAHELAHVVRRDVRSQWLAEVVRAVYWFHPIVWHAVQQLRVEAEFAADDLALSLSQPPAEYAAHLLELAVQSQGIAARYGAVGMFAASQLEGRLLAILDRRRMRKPMRGAAQRMLLGVFLAGTLALSLVRLGNDAQAASVPLSDLGGILYSKNEFSPGGSLSQQTPAIVESMESQPKIPQFPRDALPPTSFDPSFGSTPARPGSEPDSVRLLRSLMNNR